MTAARRPRVCVVSEANPLAERNGAATYLTMIARALRAAGAETLLLVTRPFPPARRRLALAPDLRAAFDRIETPGAVLVGSTLYGARPGAWLAALRPAAAPRAPAQRFWTLPAPEESQRRWLAARLEALRPDAVIANYFNAVEALEPVRAARAAVVVHDVMALRARSLEAAGQPLNFDPEMIRREAAAFARAGACVTIKAEESAFVRGIAPGTAVVELPHALRDPQTALDRKRPPVALLVGSVNSPNLDGARWLIGEVWPQVRAARPDARLRVVGPLCAALSDAPGWVEKAGVVDDLDAAYAGAAVALTPLRAGSGLKIKLVEGLAHGLPSVATTVGAEGVEDAPPDALRVADDAAGFAAAILAQLRAAEDPAIRHACRAFALGRYGFDGAVAVADALLRRLA